MNSYFIYDLENYNLQLKISKNLRQLFKDQSIHHMVEVRPHQFEMPSGNYLSMKSQVWFLGEILCQLSYMLADKNSVNKDDTFIYDTKNVILDQAIDMLCAEDGIIIKKVDFTFYLEKFKGYI
jgi:hypothetical protein